MSTVPVMVLTGELTVIVVSERIVNTGAGMDPNETCVAARKPLPVIVTNVPPAFGPLEGLTAVTAGTTAL